MTLGVIEDRIVEGEHAMRDEAGWMPSREITRLVQRWE